MTYGEASREALVEEMTRDPRVWALGEDIGIEGGTAGQYLGLVDLFGPDRIVNTPISEATIAGAGAGAAVTGTRPVVELRYGDLMLCAADEIINQAAKLRYMFNGQSRVPMVIRAASGILAGFSVHHSQSLEAIWAHIPGLIVVAPSTPQDAYGLLKSAIRAEDPVVYLEHKVLLRTTGPVVMGEEIPIGTAKVLREGADVTIVTWSAMCLRAMEAAAQLEGLGIDAEVVDLRSLWPWDRDAVAESVAKTGRLLVVHEAVRVGGFGAEVAAEIGELLWDDLRAPVRRLGAPRTPVPFSQPLEDAVSIFPPQITEAASSLVAYSRGGV